MDKAFSSVAVFGLGLIGGSVAGACKKAWPDVHVLGLTTSKETCEKAIERGWADEAYTDSSDDAFRESLSKCDLAIICTPVPFVCDYMRLLEEVGFAGVITDAASTKRHITEEAARILSHPERYIPGHPMAGSEVNGIEGAKPELFKGAHWILCPDEKTDPDAFQRLHTFVCGLGARVVSLPRGDHDQAVAIVSHVPHVVASSLVTLASRHADDKKQLMRLAAGGFKDSTRIAAGSAKLWVGIALDNAEALGNGIREMEDILQDYREAIEQGDKDRLEDLLEQSSVARRALPMAWIPSTDDLLEVRIPMEDRTGVIAEVTTIASSVGCNIQSIEIDHMTEDSAVLSMVLTDEGDVGKLSTQLIKAGYTFSFHPLSAGGR